MLSILVLHGSPRRNGNTELLTGLFLAALQKHLDARFSERWLAHPALEFCSGCRACFDRGESHCPRRDGLLAIRDELLQADLLILTSPA